MYSAVITKSGQVTLPKELREFLGVKLGDRITFEVVGDDARIHRKLSKEEFFTKLDSYKSEKTRAFLKKYGAELSNMTVSEMKEKWAKSPAGQKYLKEKYGAR